MSTYRTIQSSRLYEHIVRQIEESIRKGEMAEGSQLPAERDLAKQFGVSRTAVREAITALQESGLVDAFPGKGTFIASGSANSTLRRSLDRIVKRGMAGGWDHLVEIREILEPEIAALAAMRADPEDITAMREAIFVMDNALDPDRYIEADLDFHLTMAEAAGNPIVLSLIDSIVGLLREQKSMIFRVAGGPQRGQRHHRLILEAIRRRDPQSARAEMQAHLLQIREDSRKTNNTPDNGTEQPET